METQSAPNRDIRDYVSVVRRHKWVLVVVPLIIVAAAVAASLQQTPVYRAQAQVLLQPRVSETLFDPNARGGAVQEQVATEIQVLKSHAVKEAVRGKLGSAPEVTASGLRGTNVLAIKHTSSVPENAALVANSYAEAFIEVKRQQAVNDLLEAGDEIQTKITEIQRQIDALDAQVASAPIASREAVELSIQAERNALISQQLGFKQRFDDVQVDAALRSGGAQLITPAEVPDDPIRPTPARTGIFAGVVGLALAVALAFFLDYLDDTIKSKEDVERQSQRLPVLGVIPALESWKNADLPVAVSLTDPGSPAAEAYRSLRTSIQFAGLEQPVQVLQVTSPSAQEGKTTTIVNLGVALARAGQRVVIVDCDLRRPRLHKFFGMTNDRGLTSVMVREIALADAIFRVESEPNLVVLPSGPIPPNPSELLSSTRAIDVFRALQGRADIILLDSPPVLPVTDAAVLSRRVDGTLVVVRIGTTGRKALRNALERLRQVEAPLLGTVLNGVTEDSDYGYSYRYQYGDVARASGTNRADKAARKTARGQRAQPKGAGRRATRKSARTGASAASSQDG